MVTSCVTATAEVAGNAAVTIDPYDVENMAAGIEQLAGDETLREDLRKRGLERASEFDWEETAARTWRVLEEASQ